MTSVFVITNRRSVFERSQSYRTPQLPFLKRCLDVLMILMVYLYLRSISDLFLCPLPKNPKNSRLILPGAPGREGTQSLPNLKAGWFERPVTEFSYGFLFGQDHEGLTYMESIIFHHFPSFQMGIFQLFKSHRPKSAPTTILCLAGQEWGTPSDIGVSSWEFGELILLNDDTKWHDPVWSSEILLRPVPTFSVGPKPQTQAAAISADGRVIFCHLKPNYEASISCCTFQAPQNKSQ